MRKQIYVLDFKALALTVIKQPPPVCTSSLSAAFFLALFPLLLRSQWCWSLVNEYLGPLPHGEPDLLARFYGPFQSCPGLNTASCWPHGHNVVPCPSGEKGGRLDSCQKGFTEATSICGHVEAGGTRKKKKMLQIWCFWVAVLTSCSLCCNIKNLLRLTDRKAVPYSS